MASYRFMAPICNPLIFNERKLKILIASHHISGYRVGMTNKTNPQFNAFLTAFAAAAHLNDSEAGEQWAGFSRSLSDSERELIENGGTQSGSREGESFLKLHPVADRDETLEG